MAWAAVGHIANIVIAAKRRRIGFSQTEATLGLSDGWRLSYNPLNQINKNFNFNQIETKSFTLQPLRTLERP
jgi:hypothetical protein